MPDAAQYTLGLFDSTAIGWTVDIPPSPDPVATTPAPYHDTVDQTPTLPINRPVRGTNYALTADSGVIPPPIPK